MNKQANYHETKVTERKRRSHRCCCAAKRNKGKSWKSKKLGAYNGNVSFTLVD